MNGTDHGPGVGCERVRGRLEELVDGGLAPLAEARDEGHLEACSACAAELERVQRLLGGLALSDGPTDLDFALAGLDERLDAARGPRPLDRVLHVARAGWVPAAAVAAAGLASTLLLQGTDFARSGLVAARLAEDARVEEIIERPAWLDSFDGWVLGAEEEAR